jgi:hypothetical protein
VVEYTLRMQEALGSIPHIQRNFLIKLNTARIYKEVRKCNCVISEVVHYGIVGCNHTC